MMRAVMMALLVALPAAAQAQAWRTLDVSRQLRDTTELHVNVQYGAGRFDLRAATSPVLYSMQLHYDEEQATPLHQFDAAAGTLRVGLQREGSTWFHHGSDDDTPSMRLALAPSVPLDLSLSLGATQASVDLGGLTLRGLSLNAGAADETVDFSTPNRTRMGNVSVNVGAASFTANRLGNAHAATLQLAGGVGAVTLDFAGQWASDLDANVKVTLGSVTLLVPRDVGVRLEVSRLLASFDHDDLAKRDGYYYSDNWDSARYHLRIRVQTALGAIQVRRTGPSSAP